MKYITSAVIALSFMTHTVNAAQCDRAEQTLAVVKLLNRNHKFMWEDIIKNINDAESMSEDGTICDDPQGYQVALALCRKLAFEITDDIMNGDHPRPATKDYDYSAMATAITDFAVDFPAEWAWQAEFSCPLKQVVFKSLE